MVDVEILAPCGGKEQLIAAVRSGANAVYLGLCSHNARAKAENFDSETLVWAVRFCHARNVKVYVTLNTLVTDDEIPEIIEALRLVSKAGADAVIVQDLAVAKLVKECLKDVELHASTQMAVHNVSGVKALEKLGFSRVVLARELTFPEIEHITKNVSIETEVFIHGALCVSMSGCCYLSSILGQMSGNRGKCKGPCRLNFRANNREYILSLKDMSQIDYVKKLSEIGVSSVKIEGRLKGAEYVALAVDAVLKAKNGEQYETKQLEAAFSRSGFTDGYISGCRDIDMFGIRTQNDKQKTEQLGKKPNELFRRERQSVAIKAFVEITKEKSVLKISDGLNEVETAFEGGQVPIKSPTSYETAFQSVAKTGGTPFFVDEFKFVNNQQLFINGSNINTARKELLEELLLKREQRSSKEFFEPEKVVYKIREKSSNYFVSIRFETYSQTQNFSAWQLVDFSLPIDEIIKNIDEIMARGLKPKIEIPRLVFPLDEQTMGQKLDKLKGYGFDTVTASNIGGIYMAFERGLNVEGGFGLNILNSLSLEQYRLLGLCRSELSFELSANKIKDIQKNIDVGIVAYGFLPLMFFRNCPAKTKNGCENCSGTAKIVDRMNKQFVVLCRRKRYSVLLNQVCLDVTKRNIENIDYKMYYFTTETPESCHEIINGTLQKQKDISFTNGLYFRELI